MRFCSTCKENVYDLSELTAQEARELLRLFEGSECVRLRRRRDGTVVNADCTDAGTRARRRRVIRLMATGAATVGLVAATFGGAHLSVDETNEAESSAAARANDDADPVMGRTGGLGMLGHIDRAAARPPFRGSWVDPTTLTVDGLSLSGEPRPLPAFTSNWQVEGEPQGGSNGDGDDR